MEPVIYVPPEDHTWINVNLALSAIIFGIYIISLVIITVLISKGKILKNLILEKDVYLLTFHPIISVFMVG